VLVWNKQSFCNYWWLCFGPPRGGVSGPCRTGDGMIAGKRVCVVMPAYNAEKTVRRTVAEIDRSVADDLILVDDKSKDDTVRVLPRAGVARPVHEKNRGYGGNQKTCYAEALRRGADIVVSSIPTTVLRLRLLPGDGGHDRQRALRRGAGLAHSWASARWRVECRSGSTRRIGS